MKIALTFCAAWIALALNGANGEASWISYPGDYALWRGNDLQARRIEYGGGYPVFWATYAPHPLIDFRKDVELKAPETVGIATEGVCRIMGLGLPAPMPGVVSNRFTFPAGKYTIVARVYSQGKPPALYIDGPTVKTDSSWLADWRMAAAWQPGVVSPPAECGRDGARPSQFTLATHAAEPVVQKRIRGGHVFADFGRETFGFLKLKGVKGKGRIRIVYGESEPEALCEDFSGPDQWEYVEAEAGGEQRLKVSRGWRYVHVIPEGGVSVEGVTMDEELCPLKRVGSFRCSDGLLNRIWDVSARTLELTTRELYIEGAKRDRWTWSGDARQSYLMGYYLFGDSRLAKDTLFYQRGGDPVAMHINQIMDYTFYWFMSVREYYLYTGDRMFLEQVYDRMVSLMDFAIGRLDEKGRPHGRPGDWVFIDWAPETLHNTGGVTSFEQMLFVEALEALAEIADTVGRNDAAAYRERAAKLRAEIVPLFWSKERGGLMHLLRDDGTLDGQLTRYPNMFGLGWGYFNAEQRESVLGNVIFNDNVMEIQTPYMRFYELDVLCGLGLHKNVLHTVRSYWGGMLAEGATSFWELYNPKEKGAEKYAMYRRPYGKSLCHAWGAGPIYLMGKHILGVTPTKPGFAEYEVRPNLSGLAWIDGVVPTPHGEIHVTCSNDVLSVTGDGYGVGTLVLPDGVRRTLPQCAPMTISELHFR
ncbi:MAG: alpha-rhamnosidase [Kiritimatiellae bacterium]|nr:alpha-rhamnosidase [Kiritimatiellia bacterium]